MDIIVHSAGSGWQSILRFTSTDGNCCNIGDRVHAIFYKSDGFISIISSVSGDGNYNVRHNVDLNKWYRIEITQKVKKNGKVRYFN